MEKVIGIFSGKGGVGKTTIVSNLGIGLSSIFNKKIVILDMNVRSSHLGLHLGLYEDMPITLGDILKKNLPVVQAVYVHPLSGARIIPAPLNGADLNLVKERCYSAINKLRNDYDMIIVDSAPGLGSDVLTTVSVVDACIVVTTPDIPSVTDALKTISLVRRLKKKCLGVVVNRFRNEKYELTVGEIESTCNQKIISVIPEDKKVSESIFKGLPVVLSFSNSPASRQLKKLAGQLIGEEYEASNLLERLADIFSFWKRKSKVREKIPVAPLQKEKEDVEEIKEEMLKEVKGELKEEIIKRVKERLREKVKKG